MDEEFLTELRALGAAVPVRLDEPMARHTTFGIGGPADCYAVAATEEQLLALTDIARATTCPSSSWAPAATSSSATTASAAWSSRTTTPTARSPYPRTATAFGCAPPPGASFAALARRLAQAGLAGLEWACGIPGTLGGAVVYNAGAYGGCLADLLLSVRVANGARAHGDSGLGAGPGLSRQRLHPRHPGRQARPLRRPAVAPGRRRRPDPTHRRAGRPPPGGPAARAQRRLHLQEHTRAPRLVAHRPGGPARPSHRRRRDLGPPHQLLRQPRPRPRRRHRGPDGPGPASGSGSASASASRRRWRWWGRASVASPRPISNAAGPSAQGCIDAPACQAAAWETSRG